MENTLKRWQSEKAAAYLSRRGRREREGPGPGKAVS